MSEDSENQPIPLRPGHGSPAVSIFTRRQVDPQACDVLTNAVARALSGQLTEAAVIGRVTGSGAMFIAHSDWRDRDELAAWLRDFARQIEQGETVP